MNSSQYDALVIGGGPAGSTAALVMARAGLWVRLPESSAFPRFHVGESLLPRFSLFAENPAQSIDQPAFAGAG